MIMEPSALTLPLSSLSPECLGSNTSLVVPATQGKSLIQIEMMIMFILQTCCEDSMSEDLKSDRK